MKVITVGRSRENNNIVIQDEKVSRNHLQIIQDDNGTYKVMDLGSTNGTFVNGLRITGELQLKEGDKVKIGETFLPWQSYFVPQSKPIIAAPIVGKNKHQGDRVSPLKPYRRYLYIGASIVLVLLIVGGILWKVQDEQQKKLQAYIEYKEGQIRAAEEEAQQAWKEYEEAKARGASQEELDMKYKIAEAKQQQSDEINRTNTAEIEEAKSSGEVEPKKEEQPKPTAKPAQPSTPTQPVAKLPVVSSPAPTSPVVTSPAVTGGIEQDFNEYLEKIKKLTPDKVFDGLNEFCKYYNDIPRKDRNKVKIKTARDTYTLTNNIKTAFNDKETNKEYFIQKMKEFINSYTPPKKNKK